MIETITLVLFGEEAKKIEQIMGLQRCGDTADVNTKIVFTKEPAEGKSRIKMEFDL